MRIFITGGTGVIGVRLIRQLIARGDTVVAISRKPQAWERIGPEPELVIGDANQPGDWQAKLAECDAVVHLAGAGIFDRRWSEDYKREMRDSRIHTTDNIAVTLKQSPKRADGSPKVFVSSSAIGYYGPRGSEDVTEDTPPGKDFLSRLCVEWEAAAQQAETAGVRVVLLRTGIVQDKLGSALKQLLTPFKLGLGGPVGMGLNPANWGRQYWSWIHHADEVGLILLALDNANARGPMNATAPNPVTSKEYAKILGRVLGRPAFAPLPALALRVIMGEVAKIIVTGQRVIPAKALALGFKFQFPELEPALRDILKKC